MSKQYIFILSCSLQCKSTDGTQIGKLITATQFCITEHQRIEFKLPYLPCTCFVCNYIKHTLYWLGPQESQTVAHSDKDKILNKAAVECGTSYFLWIFQSNLLLCTQSIIFCLALTVQSWHSIHINIKLYSSRANKYVIFFPSTITNT